MAGLTTPIWIHPEQEGRDEASEGSGSPCFGSAENLSGPGSPQLHNGPPRVPHVQSDIVVKSLQGKVSSRHTCRPLEHLDIPSISVTESAPGGPVVDSPFAFPPFIQKLAESAPVGTSHPALQEK